MTGSTVWYLPLHDGATVEEQAEATRQLMDKCDAGRVVDEHDFVAVKLHVGERTNKTHVKPEVVKVVVDEIRERGGQAFLAETSTLYKGERENAVKHILHAHAHGFSIEKTGAPFIMVDGLMGNTETEIVINGIHHQSVKVGSELAGIDALFSVAHMTGHMVTGIGATLKTIGMGLASRQGKLRQHSSLRPHINPEICRFCKKCMQWCPKDAIIERDKKAFIVEEKCIGCGECLAVCRFTAVEFEWSAESKALQESMAEHAYGALKRILHKCFFINVMMDMTSECDCLADDQAVVFGVEQKKVLNDMGIMASFDPVALDMASLELTAKEHGQNLAELSHPHQNPLYQIEHAARVGLGSLKYKLVTL